MDFGPIGVKARKLPFLRILAFLARFFLAGVRIRFFVLDAQCITKATTRLFLGSLSGELVLVVVYQASDNFSLSNICIVI